MYKKSQYDLNNINKYINSELSKDTIDEKRKKELRILLKYYNSSNNVTSICNEENIGRSTFYRIINRFNKIYYSNGSYDNLKYGMNKLNNNQKKQLKNSLESSPFNSKIPYLEWDKDVLKTYLSNKFNIDYTERQCTNIINKNNIYYDPRKELNKILLNYDNILFLDLFKVVTKGIIDKNSDRKVKVIRRNEDRDIFLFLGYDLNWNIVHEILVINKYNNLNSLNLLKGNNSKTIAIIKYNKLNNMIIENLTYKNIIIVKKDLYYELVNKKYILKLEELKKELKEEFNTSKIDLKCKYREKIKNIISIYNN
ncbi:TPA: hypothetical protein I9Z34_002346 [Clostridium perfringens]|nr:hypothetical protein [Clostridium perfringens]HAT4290001.1 hypothetical protein [Clostridium perfringens]